MNETCDRCGPAVRAAYRTEGNGELYLCGHCAAYQQAALTSQGFVLSPLSLHGIGIVPQAA